MKIPLLASLVLVAALTTFGADKKIVFIAGPPSHGPGDHEYRADCLLFKSCLDKIPGVTSVVYSNGWPADPSAAFEGASEIVICSDGGPAHPFLQANHLKMIGDMMGKGIGLGCIHYAVEPTKEKGETEFIDWLLRGRSLRESHLEGQIRKISRPSHHSRRQTLRDHR